MDACIDRLRTDVGRLTSHPDRVVGSAGHVAARTWAVDRFRTLGLASLTGHSFELPYEHRGARFANVAGVIPGSRGEGGLPVVLGAHYDTVAGTPGADDNAASLAIVAEVAARLVRHPASRPVLVVAFDAEEPPHFQQRTMGSIRFVEDHVGERVHAAIVLDLVAHAIPLDGLRDVVALMGAESHPAWVDVVERLAQGPFSLLTVPNAVMPDMSDHRAFRLAGRPYLFVTCGQGPDYHRPTDTLARLDLRKAAVVADLVEQIVRASAESQMDGATPHDTRDLDYALMKRALTDEALAWFDVRSAADATRGLTRLAWHLQGAR